MAAGKLKAAARLVLNLSHLQVPQLPRFELSEGDLQTLGSVTPPEMKRTVFMAVSYPMNLERL